MRKQAKANVKPIRQRTQYTCMAASLSMCLKANGLDYDEETVNKVMGARPMQGASWEQAFAAAQHFGQRVTMIIPATLNQVKEYTDKGVPVMIAWNPEGRPWSHASVIFDVTDDGMVHIADPNIPDPDETVRVIPKEEFYKKWFEDFGDYLVRRPALAIEPEITQEGKQRVASAKRASEVYVDARGFAHDLEGNSWPVRMMPGVYPANKVPRPSNPSRKPSRTFFRPSYRVDSPQTRALDKLKEKLPNNAFVSSLADQLQRERPLSDKQKNAVINLLLKFGMKTDAEAFGWFDPNHLALNWREGLKNGSRYWTLSAKGLKFALQEVPGSDPGFHLYARIEPDGAWYVHKKVYSSPNLAEKRVQRDLGIWDVVLNKDDRFMKANDYVPVQAKPKLAGYHRWPPPNVKPTLRWQEGSQFGNRKWTYRTPDLTFVILETLDGDRNDLVTLGARYWVYVLDSDGVWWLDKKPFSFFSGAEHQVIYTLDWWKRKQPSSLKDVFPIPTYSVTPNPRLASIRRIVSRWLERQQ